MNVAVTFNALPAFIAETNREVKEAVKSSSEKIVGTAKNAIDTGSRSGRVYKRRGRVHQASAPGEAPAGDSGTLENSGAVEVSPDGMTATATFNAPHASDLETGTADIAARPFLGPAAQSQERGYIAAVGKGVHDAARKVGKSS
jgi:hypothetical protein